MSGPILPDRVIRRIEEVLDRSGLEDTERADVRAELIAHFEDGLAAGRDVEELIGAFGEAQVAGRLIGAERGTAGIGVGAGLGVRVSGLARDVRLAFRRFRSNPGFVATAILSLAIGIGANTAIFTLVNALLVREQPYAAPERLYEVYLGTAAFPYGTFSHPDLMDLKEGVGELVSSVPASQFTVVKSWPGRMLSAWFCRFPPCGNATRLSGPGCCGTPSAGCAATCAASMPTNGRDSSRPFRAWCNDARNGLASIR
jgi:hypothetical protein